MKITRTKKSIKSSKVVSSTMYEDLDGCIVGKGKKTSLEDLKTMYEDLHKYDPVINQYDSFEDWMKDNVDNGYLREIVSSRNLDTVDYKKDRRLSPTNIRYKGYLIALDRAGDGYNIYDRNRELEDAGFASLDDAKKFIDKISVESSISASKEPSICASRFIRPGDIIIIKKDYPVGWMNGEDLFLPAGTRLEYYGGDSDSGLISLQDIDSEEPQIINLTEEQYYKAFRQGYFKKAKANVSSAEEVDQDENDLDQVDQEFTSKETSINSGKLPAIYKLVNFPKGSLVIDYGGGKFDNGVEYLDTLGVTGLVYDPYNRTTEHNRSVIKQIRQNGGADIALCSNVLNVIKEPEARIRVLKNIRNLLKPSGVAYITVYEGSGSGEGKQSQKDSYQLNKKTADYLDEIKTVFPDAERKGKLIYAHPTGDITASVNFEYDYKTKWPDYCPCCHNRTLVKIGDDHFVCEECAEEYEGYPSYEGGLYLKKLSDIEGSCKVESAVTIIRSDLEKLAQKALEVTTIEDLNKVISPLLVHNRDKWSEYSELARNGEYSPAAIGKMISDDLYWELQEPENDLIVDDIEESCKVESASYGGSYDIEDDQYFTKEELMEFAYYLADSFAETHANFEFSDLEMNNNLLEITITDGEIELKAIVHVDMRRIHKPSDIYKYSDFMLKQFKEGYDEYYSYDDTEVNVSSGCKVESSTAPYKRSEFIKQLTDELYNKASEVMQSEDFGYDLSEIADYLFVDVNETPDGVVAEVRAELSFEGTWKLLEQLNPIVQKYDSDSYFDMVEPGINEAFIRMKFVEEAVDSAVDINYEEPIEDEKIYKVDFQNTVEVSDGVYLPFPDDETFDDIVDDVYDMKVVDGDQVADNILDLIVNNIPEENGKYKVSGKANLKYFLHDIYEGIEESGDPDSFAPDIFYITEDAKADYDPNGSFVEYFQCEKID